MINIDKQVDSIIDKLIDWIECDEHHIHDGTGEHEGSTPLPHDFNDDDAKSALKKLIVEARVEELEKSRRKLIDYYNREFRGKKYLSVPQAILDDAIRYLKEGKDI